MRKLWMGFVASLFAGASLCAAGSVPADSPGEKCRSQLKDTEAHLLECMRGQQLWEHLSAFQKIADRYPGADGHGNRDTGTPGYKASVTYVAQLLRNAGYRITIQTYQWYRFGVNGTPRFSADGHSYQFEQDWFVARLSGSGMLDAEIEPAGGATAGEAADGCSPGDFAGFTPGRIALVRRGACAPDDEAANAEAAGASAVVIYASKGAVPVKGEPVDGRAFQAHLTQPAGIPVIDMLSNAAGSDLYRRYRTLGAVPAQLDIRTSRLPDVDYNLIAESPYGDPNSVVIVDAHLDSIYGAGMLDNASGSTTILELALQLAKTPTAHQLRYIWFGGEELGLLGSHYYARNLSSDDLKKIAFDIDVDVTATPNFAILIADPGRAGNVDRFPSNVVPESRIGNDAFADYFRSIGVPSRDGNNNGTDSNSLSLVGVPNSGIYTQQDCCKSASQVRLWGGFRGNYEGDVPGFNGGCVDQPHRWCDNLSNNDRFVLGLVSKAVASVVFKLANDASLPPGGNGR